MADRPMLPIPVSAARRIAKDFGYDQVIVIARRTGEYPQPLGEHVTTYGCSQEHCAVATRVGNFLKHKVMGWPEHTTPPAMPDTAQLQSMAAAFRAAHDGHAAERIPKIYAKGQREEANVIVGLRAALEVLAGKASTNA